MTERKVIIVDDEMPARKLLREYIGMHPELSIVAECQHGSEAIESIDALQPDLVFLDVQMPGKSGFDVLQEIRYIPAVIFTTAYDKYAIKAFDVNAVDYLLKPYTRERFNAAIAKLSQGGLDNLRRLQSLTESLSVQNFPERILVESRQKLLSVSVRDIAWFEADKDYTRIHIGNQVYLSNKGISELEKKLNPQQFVRIHRSIIISLNHIKEVHKEASGPRIVLSDHAVVRVSRSYTDVIKKLIY